MKSRMRTTITPKLQNKVTLKVKLIRSASVVSIVGIAVFLATLFYNNFLNNTTSKATVILTEFPAGTYKIGGTGSTPSVGCRFVDLTDAAAALSTSRITGPVTFVLTSTYRSTEERSFPIVFGQIEGANETNTITIKPDANATVNISGSSSSSVIKFSGAENYIIDGSNNGTGSKNLNITNTSTANNTAAIWLSSLGDGIGSNNITIKNTNIKTGTNTSWSNKSFGIIIGGIRLGNDYTNDYLGSNNNITIQGNNISKALWGIWLSGKATETGKIDNIKILSNTIGSDISGEQIGFIGIDINEVTNSKIDGNTIKNISSSIANNNLQRPMGIWLGNSSSLEITNNIISGVAYTGSGNYGVKGIEVYGMVNNGNQNLLIANNVICNFTGRGSSQIDASFSGIKINPAGKLIGGIKLYNNSVYFTGNVASSGIWSASLYIANGSAQSLDIQNNAFINKFNHANPKSYSIYAESTTLSFTDLNFNAYYSINSGFLNFFSNKDQATFGAWKTATKYDSRSVNGDPGFRSATNLIPDTLQPSAWILNGKGVQLAVNDNDLRGVVRNVEVDKGIPDIGAYEYTPAANSIPAVCTQDRAPANNTTCNYFYANQLVATIKWYGASLPSVSIRYYSDKLPDSLGKGDHSYVYWDITATGGSNYSYDIELPYHPSVLGTIESEGDIIIAKRHGSEPWENLTSAFVNTTNNTVKYTGLRTFSKFILSSKKNPLPIELMSFAAESSNNTVLLKWITAAEINNDFFTLERSSDGINFIPFATIKGAGNSNTLLTYQYIDESPEKTINYYRLKQTDYDAKFTYSSIITVKMNNPKEYQPLKIQNIGPNPFRNELSLNCYSQENEVIVLNLYNLTGQKVYSETFNTLEGINTIKTSSINELNKGVYLCNISNESFTTATVKIIKE